MKPEMRPKQCPRCGRATHFYYTREKEARLRAPLCWGESEQDCPGYAKYKQERDADDEFGRNLIYQHS